MAADAILLENLSAVVRDPYPFRSKAGKEETNVFYAVKRLPDVMDRHVLVRQMTVDAFFSPVRACM
jgi:hypothetical protein